LLGAQMLLLSTGAGNPVIVVAAKIILMNILI